MLIRDPSLAELSKTVSVPSPVELERHAELEGAARARPGRRRHEVLGDDGSVGIRQLVLEVRLERVRGACHAKRARHLLERERRLDEDCGRYVLEVGTGHPVSVPGSRPARPSRELGERVDDLRERFGEQLDVELNRRDPSSIDTSVSSIPSGIAVVSRAPLLLGRALEQLAEDLRRDAPASRQSRATGQPCRHAASRRGRADALRVGAVVVVRSSFARLACAARGQDDESGGEKRTLHGQSVEAVTRIGHDLGHAPAQVAMVENEPEAQPRRRLLLEPLPEVDRLPERPRDVAHVVVRVRLSSAASAPGSAQRSTNRPSCQMSTAGRWPAHATRAASTSRSFR